MINFETIFEAGYTVDMGNAHEEMHILDSLFSINQTNSRKISKYRIRLEPEKMGWLCDIEKAIASIISEETNNFLQKIISESPERRTPLGMLPNNLQVHPFKLMSWGMLLVNHNVYKNVISRAYKEIRYCQETRAEVEKKVLWVIINSLEPKNKSSFKFIMEERLNLLYAPGGRFLSTNWKRPPIGKEFERRESKAWLLVTACIDAYQRHHGHKPLTDQQLIDFSTSHNVDGYLSIVDSGGDYDRRKITWTGDSLYWRRFSEAFTKIIKDQ